MSGLKFDLSKDEPTFCEACVYAKATRKPVAKERVGEHATEFGAEVHMTSGDQLLSKRLEDGITILHSRMTKPA